MIKVVIGFKRRQGMGIQEFRDYRRDVHAPILFAIPEAKNIRRFVVSYPAEVVPAEEPRFDAIVEAWFDNSDDMNTLFQSDNFATRVDPDHVNFIDLTTVVRLVTEELIVIE
ncbi:EthD family reductase [Chimaeribacter coloradensis]|uniref:EthD family reductase n=1 Tax=Chimaeribacter coloradensis TaxID=2060068 RepID=A0A2N5E5T7_9GAMM|nr:EthD domain-containing protein [Chimaeribacter coloradensis]PLR36517.1 EthD family reductase [Chimaeribacter coloradensis]